MDTQLSSRYGHSLLKGHHAQNALDDSYDAPKPSGPSPAELAIQADTASQFVRRAAMSANNPAAMMEALNVVESIEVRYSQLHLSAADRALLDGIAHDAPSPAVRRKAAEVEEYNLG